MIYTIERTSSFFSFTFSPLGGGEGGWKVLLTSTNTAFVCTSTPTGKLSALILACEASLGRAENNKCEPLNLHSASITPGKLFLLRTPRQQLRTPTCSSNNSKSNHIGFPLLVSKGHSLSWFFSFNSCKGIELPPCPPSPSPKHPHSHPLSARESGGRNRGLSICTQTVGQPKKPQWIVTHYWNYQALIKLATLSPLGCAHLQLNFSSSDSNREAALAATGC